MKKLLMLLVVFCFCLAPVVALAGNTAPRLNLEIYEYDTDPGDPDFGCVLHAPLCPEICVHSEAHVDVLQCYHAKTAPYYFGIVPIHCGQMDTPPLAAGWPLPAGPGGGYVGLSYGVLRSGIAATFVGYVACPGFLQGPGTAPAAIVVSATSQCHDWQDHTGYAKYMSSTNPGASYFTIVINADEAAVKVINCQANLDLGRTIGNGAQWGGTKTIVCEAGPTAVELTTWGKIKGLYR